jgi:hypothetical protein
VETVHEGDAQAGNAGFLKACPDQPRRRIGRIEVGRVADHRQGHDLLIGACLVVARSDGQIGIDPGARRVGVNPRRKAEQRG